VAVRRPPLGGVSAARRHGSPATTPVSYPGRRCALIPRTRSVERGTAPDVRGAVSDEAEEAKDQKDDHDRDDYPDNSSGASHF
jgi:hypothetical protein